MSATRVLAGIAGSFALFAGATLACTNIYGIPGECRMRAVVCDPAGEEPEELMSVAMEGNWTYSACNPSHDGAVNVLSVAPDQLEVQYRGRRAWIPRAPFYGGHVVEWDSSDRRFAFWAPLEKGKGVGVCDVRAMSGSRPYRVVYEAPAATSPYGFVWVPDQDALLVIEQRVEPDRDQTVGAVVRVDLDTLETRDLVVEAGGLDFVMTVHHGSAGASPKALVGSRTGLRLVDPATGAVQPLPGLPALGLFNVELSHDGRRAALYYRRAVPAADGRPFFGLYVVDFAKLAAGEPEATTKLYDGVDVHTLWLSPRSDEVLWATPWSVYRCSATAPSEGARSVLSVSEGEPEIKGAAYEPDGSRLAITRGDRLVVHDLATGGTTEVARFGEQSFVADPRWTHGRILVSVFEDVAPQRPAPRFQPRPAPGGRR